jgi:hypothetical protein
MRPVSTPAAKALLGNRSHASGADQTASWCSNLHLAAELDHPVRRNVEKFRRRQRTARYILVRVLDTTRRHRAMGENGAVRPPVGPWSQVSQRE